MDRERLTRLALTMPTQSDDGRSLGMEDIVVAFAEASVAIKISLKFVYMMALKVNRVCNLPPVYCWSLETTSHFPMERAIFHSDQSSGSAWTTHRPHTKKAKSQLFDLHPVPIHC